MVAATLYDNAAHLPAALDSLLAQTYERFRLVLLDDCSSDDTPAIARRYAQRDARVVYERNARRLGLLGSWRRAFERARERFPGAMYFAWASDHDVWEREWLETLVAELDAHPEAVAAYSLSERILESGDVVTRPSGRPKALAEVDTAGVRSPRRRVWRARRRVNAGSIVYALFRADALEHAGVMRPVLAPDRLLVSELAYAGEFRQAPAVLWRRRFRGLYSASRQRAASFPDGAPAYTYLPVRLQHVAALVGAYVVRRPPPPVGNRARGASFAIWLATVELVDAIVRAGRALRKLVFRTDRPLAMLVKRLQRLGKRRRSTRRSVRRLRAVAGRAVRGLVSRR